MEHARWFNKCAFVRLRKGDDFIRQSIENKPPPEDEQLPQQQQRGGSGGGGREVTEDDIRMAMSEAVVRQVLSMGIDPSRVKMAIKKQLESYGYGFNQPEHLINAAFSVQRQQERRVTHEHNFPSGAMLAGPGQFSSSSSSRPRQQQQSQQPPPPQQQQRRSFDEVTMRRWEEEMYMSTEDEDETNMPQPSAAPMSSFRSLPSGVKLTAPSSSTMMPPQAPNNTNNNNTSGTSVQNEIPSPPSTSHSSQSQNSQEEHQQPGPSTSTTTPNSTAAGVQNEQDQNIPCTTETNSQNNKDIDTKPVSTHTSSSMSQVVATNESLEVENARLKEQRTCKICLDNEVIMILIMLQHQNRIRDRL